MKRSTVYFAFGLLALTGLAATASAHCQIPCGIYDDELRVKLVEEHITTVEKSMKEIVTLSSQTPVNYNQLVRWVTNKEEHANRIQEVVTQYFMAQRVKVPATASGEEYQAYLTRLNLLHEMLVTAMQAKQSTDLAHVARLRELVARFRTAYFGEAGTHAH